MNRSLRTRATKNERPRSATGVVCRQPPAGWADGLSGLRVSLRQRRPAEWRGDGRRCAIVPVADASGLVPRVTDVSGCSGMGGNRVVDPAFAATPRDVAMGQSCVDAWYGV